MKVNLPVTSNERHLPRGEYIVSKTDLKGATTYANETFIEVSGFSAEELIGKNHNIVRHPDMPPQAFKWLWDTIREGRPWRGVVKNRCKNGDFYWVDALVVPVRRNDRTEGYMSVRTPPQREQITAAESLYRALNASGAAIPQPPRWKRIALRTKLIGLVALMVAMQCLGGLVGLFGDSAGLSATAIERILQVLGIGVIVAGASLAWMQHAALKVIDRTTRELDRISQGDLTREIPFDRLDELGRLNDGLITMQTHLKVMMAEIAEMATTVGDKARGFSTEMSRVHGQSEQQTGSVMNMAGAMVEVNASIHEAADSARATAQAVGESGRELDRVKAQMQHSRAASQAVVGAMDAAGQTMSELFRSIEQIGTITRGIQEIAEQTNLLALNAAIEAARAGEMGRGFAVVADEVRNLAERSRQRTEEIGRTVERIQQATHLAVDSMAAAGAQVRQTDTEMDATEAGLYRVAEQGERIDDMAQQIASAATQQSQASEDITADINRIAAATEANLAAVAQTRDSATALERTSAKLHELIHFFRYIREQSDAATAPRRGTAA
ncbi:MAG TPA: methyl-accepting chemotaxis protein [Rhodocyclaceae bacterium]|nr:methyl-accepting chemotaxis protein [Rhodocyclaceae bacterium]